MENKNTKPGKPKQSKVAITFKIIGSTLFICAFIFCATWTVKNWNKVSNSLTSGTKLSTEEDLKNSWTDGYNSAFTDKEKLEQELNSIKESYTQLKDEKAESDKTYQDIINSNQKTYEENLAKLEADLATSASNIQNLTNQLNSEIADNEVLTAEITKLNNKILVLTNQNLEKTALIEELQSDVAELQNLLNIEINNNRNNSATIQQYQETITKLNNTIKEYEDYYNSINNPDTAIVQVEYNNEIISIETMEIGSIKTLENIESTEKIKFNGWLVNGQKLTSNDYVIRENITFVADLTYYYDQIFYVDNVVYTSHLIEKGNDLPEISNPSKDGNLFIGWSTDGENVIDTTNVIVNSDTNYIALFQECEVLTHTSSITSFVVGYDCSTKEIHHNPIQFEIISNTYVDGIKNKYPGFENFISIKSFECVMTFNFRNHYDCVSNGYYSHKEIDFEQEVKILLDKSNNFTQTVSIACNIDNTDIEIINFTLTLNENGKITTTVNDYTTEPVQAFAYYSPCTLTYYSNTEVAE